MSDETELKHCPFCGTPANRYSYRDFEVDANLHSCAGSGLWCSLCNLLWFPGYDSQDEAQKAETKVNE